MTQKIMCAALATVCAASVSAADLYVSLATGKNKNAGTKEAPLKNLWKALEKAETGDTIHLAEGNYPGKMKCGWFMMTKPVSIIGGYSADFATRDPLIRSRTARSSSPRTNTTTRRVPGAASCTSSSRSRPRRPPRASR